MCDSNCVSYLMETPQLQICVFSDISGKMWLTRHICNGNAASVTNYTNIT